MSGSVAELLEHAGRVLDAHEVPAWPRATAVLLRQALEAAIDEVWSGREPAMIDTSWRSKQVALVGYVPADIALETASLWGTLSAACHVHEYDLAPTTTDLRMLLTTSQRVCALLTVPVA